MLIGIELEKSKCLDESGELLKGKMLLTEWDNIIVLADGIFTSLWKAPQHRAVNH